MVSEFRPGTDKTPDIKHPYSILIADDDASIRLVLSQAFGRLGYQVRATGNATTLLKWVSEGEGDLVITDVVMPDENVFDVLPRIRKQRPKLPVIVMSAQNTLLTAVNAAEVGAFEYVAKPFDLGELIARAKALIRRGKGAAHPTLNVLGLSVNTLEQTVRRAGLLVDLSPTEYRVLEYLIYRPRVIVSKRELLEHLYDYNWEHHSNVIEVHVSNLRKKLDAVHPEAEPIIETMRGRGYRLAPSLPSEPESARLLDQSTEPGK